MIDHQRAEEMQVNNEASPGCLKPNISQYNPQEHRSGVEGFPENKEKKNDITAADKVWEASPLPNQGFSRPFYHPEFYAWPHVYSDYQILRQPQPYGFDNQFYQINRVHSFPMEKRDQFPLKMLPQDAQLQEFQYFVVIDFEATCDKDNNPHPQEIIEFPSVLVNSATGQLEASFQTYVRPTYHQNLTDFCKELTGIQQIQANRYEVHDKFVEVELLKIITKQHHERILTLLNDANHLRQERDELLHEKVMLLHDKIEVEDQKKKLEKDVDHLESSSSELMTMHIANIINLGKKNGKILKIEAIIHS